MTCKTVRKGDIYQNALNQPRTVDHDGLLVPNPKVVTVAEMIQCLVELGYRAPKLRHKGEVAEGEAPCGS